MAEPWTVPEEPATTLDVRSGLDTDCDMRPDTILTSLGEELLIHTDLDGDGFADQVLGIGPDGTVRVWVPDPPAVELADDGVVDAVISAWYG